MDDARELVMSLKAVAREIERRDNDLMRPLGVTGVQADALMAIARLQPVSLGDLGAHLIAESGHPSRLVDRLVDAGHVQREGGEHDRRRVKLSLTPTGRRLERRITQVRDEAMTSAATAIGPDDLASALALVRRLLAASDLAPVVARRVAMLQGAAGD